MWRRTGSYCVYLGEKVPNRKFSRVNDKQSIAGNSVETGKIWNRIVMMNSAMTLGVAMAIIVGLVVAWRRSAFM
jgi:hypothetical protein